MLWAESPLCSEVEERVMTEVVVVAAEEEEERVCMVLWPRYLVESSVLRALTKQRCQASNFDSSGAGSKAGTKEGCMRGCCGHICSITPLR